MPGVTPAPVPAEAADASFLDSLMEVLERASENRHGEPAPGRAEAKLSRELRDAIGGRLRDAA